MADWYAKLREYFPEREMKSEQQMLQLFADNETYKRDAGPEYVLIYQEKEDFIFVDYILISGRYRGNGMGSSLISRLKKKNKPILLEVEPENDTDKDSKKRIQFYERNGFKRAGTILYQRRHVITDELNDMEIYCWAPQRKSEEWIYSKMREIYSEIHCHKAEEVYGKKMQPASEVLSFKTDRYKIAK
ncbi:GNAT family N-acetyltransferase [Peribacillus kribbensis]|uniref:GNAT family N-acetyltransferase n=1 Tax=Peribacillus kribbensis TaxID=356658 RepID=UPI00041CBBC6|nr:GNAT family N-acetyltransferase [Peribacillus kribbensis]